MLLLGLANLLYRQLKESRLMLKRLRLDEQVSKVVGHHPLGTMLGWIDTHDSEPFTSHLPDARADDAIRLLQALFLWLIRLAKHTVTRSYMIRHLDSPFWGMVEGPNSIPNSIPDCRFLSKESFSNSKPSYLFTTEASKGNLQSAFGAALLRAQGGVRPLTTGLIVSTTRRD